MRGAAMQDQQAAESQVARRDQIDRAPAVSSPKAEDMPSGAVENIPQTIAARRYDYAYYRSIFGNHPMPFAYVDLDLLAQNMCQVVARVRGDERKAGKRVRLASKSLRCVAITRRILASDACFQG